MHSYDDEEQNDGVGFKINSVLYSQARTSVLDKHLSTLKHQRQLTRKDISNEMKEEIVNEYRSKLNAKFTVSNLLTSEVESELYGESTSDSVSIPSPPLVGIGAANAVSVQ